MATAKINADALKGLSDSTDYTAEPFDRGGFFIGGLTGGMYIESEEDARVIAAALNAAKSYRKLRRKAASLLAEAQCFVGE